jgi:hypothetical protein
VLKHCAASRKRRLSALPNAGPYIYDMKISGFTRSSIYIYNISRLRVKPPLVELKGKATPLQAWTGPEGSRSLRLPNFKTVGT